MFYNLATSKRREQQQCFYDSCMEVDEETAAFQCNVRASGIVEVMEDISFMYHSNFKQLHLWNFYSVNFVVTYILDP